MLADAGWVVQDRAASTPQFNPAAAIQNRATARVAPTALT
jgi:hypothetical protein